VVVGHAVRDLTPGGWTLGGTVTFAAVQAHRLGRRVGVVTRAGADLDVQQELSFAQVAQSASPETTTFENVYAAGHRSQRVRARASAIEGSDIPDRWREAAIVLIGPVFGETPPALAAAFAEASLVGVSAQGWLRALDDEGNVVRASWEGEPFWHAADVVFVSDEDLAGGRDELELWTKDARIVAMTESRKGAQIYAEGRWRSMPAFPEIEVDPTGAGDTFATAFLIRLHETGDVAEAARFGAAAASLSVSGVGAASMPERAQIEERMDEYPEVALR
jgi:sugar/nucleoside kinase (ribokinase family)